MFSHHHRRGGLWKGLEINPAAVMAAIALGDTLTLDKPSGTASGDLLIAVMGAVSGTWSPPASFSEQVDGNSIAVATRVADGGEGSSFTFTCSISGQNKCGGIIRIPGGTFDLVGATAASMTAPGITMTGDGILIGAYFDNSNGTSFGTPAGMEAVSGGYIDTHGSMALFSQIQGSGATGDRVSSNGDTSVLFAAKVV